MAAFVFRNRRTPPRQVTVVAGLILSMLASSLASTMAILRLMRMGQDLRG